eukprot:scaffold20729_cov114-Isochrysis_galbana.AAC.2
MAIGVVVTVIGCTPTGEHVWGQPAGASWSLPAAAVAGLAPTLSTVAVQLVVGGGAAEEAADGGFRGAGEGHREREADAVGDAGDVVRQLGAR